MTYIGFTLDVPRRVRQHNGEITGGAKRTARHRPWKPVVFVTGFASRTAALQFEWQCTCFGATASARDFVDQHRSHGQGNTRTSAC